MTRMFGIPCDFGGKKQNVLFAIGAPSPEKHPIHFQSSWLASTKGGTVSPEVMDSMAKLYALSQKHKVLFEDLFFYAVNVANGINAEENKNNNNDKFAKIIEELDDKNDKNN